MNTSLHDDDFSSTTGLMTAGEGLAASYRYDAYGNLAGASGSLALANVYRFSSKEWHLNSGLYYYGYRFYSPNWQRWLNRDPLGERGFTTLVKHKGFKKAHLAPQMAELSQGPNLYTFVGNSSVNRFDRFGLKYSEEECADLLNLMDFLFTLRGRAGVDDNTLQKEINRLQDEYDENCGDDDDGDNPQLNPLPVPGCSRKEESQPALSFCQRHPWVCGGVVIGVGVAIGCTVCPECCVIGVIVGAPVGI
ncbi:MAG: RHS repeat-associated core domain-containing protein [Verrucomicrobiae bacterium]|nr:RHS repeat-associated core domain-containing protein [Verrucomicrobiae bacterium]